MKKVVTILLCVFPLCCLGSVSPGHNPNQNQSERIDSIYYKACELYNNERALDISKSLFCSVIEAYLEGSYVDTPKYFHSLLYLSNINAYEGHYDNAVDYAHKTLKYLDSTNKRESDEIILVYLSLAHHLIVSNQGEEGEKYLEAANDILKRDTSHPKPQVAYALYVSALKAYYDENWRLSETFLKSSLSIYETTGNNTDEEYAQALQLLSECKYMLGEIKTAIDIQLQCIKVRSLFLSPCNFLYKESYGNLAAYYVDEGDYLQAELYQQKCIDIIDYINGKESKEYIDALESLCYIYDYSDSYDKIIDTYGIICEIVLHSNIFSNEEACSYLITQASFCSSVGKHKDAIEYAKILLNEAHPFNDDKSLYIDFLIIASSIYKNAGHISEALSILDRAELLSDTINAVDYVRKGNILSYKARCYSCLNNIKLAIEAEDRAFEVLSHTNCQIDSLYSECLSHKASFYSNYGDYHTAIDLQLEANDILQKLYGKQNELYIDGLDQLALYYDRIGNVQENLKLVKAISNWKLNKYGKESEEYFAHLSNLAVAYSNNHEHKKSVSISEDVVAIAEHLYNRLSDEYALALMNYATILHDNGEYSKAAEIGEDACNIVLELHGDSDRESLDALSNLAVLYSDNHNYQEALHCGKHAKEIANNVLGKNHPDRIVLTGNLARLYHDTQNIDSTIVYTKEYIQLVISDIYNRFPVLTYDEQRYYWGRYSTFFYDYIPICAENCGLPELYSDLYNAVLFSKGLLLSSQVALKESISSLADSDLTAEFNQMTTMQYEYDSISLLPENDRTMNIDSLYSSIRMKQKRILSKVQSRMNYMDAININWIDVKNHLDKHEVAIEFVSYPVGEMEIQYSALVITQHSDCPEFIPLFKESELNAIPQHQLYETGELYSLAWGPIQKTISNCNHIYFSTSGKLNMIAIESCALSTNKCFSDIYTCNRLSSTRQLVLENSRKDIDTVALFGGMKYDADIYKNVNDVLSYASTSNSDKRSTTYYPSRSGYSYLPGTLTEINNVSSVFNNKYNVHVFCGDDGTEDSFKSLSGHNVQIVHIATHGFYYEENSAHKIPYTKFQNLKATRFTDDISLSCSGLLFSGANKALKGYTMSADVEDGILSADEVQYMDLSGTNILVLSACQTGLGKITGDGVFGLQRGFKVAGVGSIIMSLWEVDDKATSILMTKFYQEIVDGKNCETALSLAKKTVRNYKINGKKVYDDPKYWAAFILLD